MGSYKPKEIDLVPSDLEFAVFSSHEIKKISVVKIVTGLTYDALGHPLPGGLHDTLMGTNGDRIQDPCPTCLSGYGCAGHMGHIELNALVYNPFFIKCLQKILTVFCLKCFKIQIGDHIIELVKLQLQLIDAGFITEAQELENFKSAIACQSSENIKLENGDSVHPRIAQLYELIEREKANDTNQNVIVTKTSCAIRTAVINSILQRPSNSKCRHCSETIRFLRYMHRKLVYYITAAEIHKKTQSTDSTGKNKVILADECRNMLRQIYMNYPELIRLLFPVLQVSERTAVDDSCPTDLFFMDVIAVTPPKARPANIVRGLIIEHTQTVIYRQIIENNNVLRVVLKRMKDQINDLPAEANTVYESCKGATAHEKLYNAWQDLQNSVDLLLDTSYSRTSSSIQGLKQIIEKKDGLIRKHMMGKRVNYAARTVITPDPNINVEEVGIPDIFARKLSYPVPVTPWNISELRKMVLNGPLVHPGANYIEDERGNTTLIPATDRIKRESMAKLLFNFPENGTKIVHRHMINGDVLLLNRQPTLHRPSIMAHKARILQGEKTFRLHYSNCKAYNADFDGDEMNAHYPQNELARAEAYNLVNVASNYLVPKDGTPLGGLIQDHVISGVKLSLRGRFFNREDYQQLVFQGLSHINHNIELLPPSIIKPVRLWSGKEVLSTIISNIIPEKYSRINLNSISRIGVKRWVTQSPRMPWGAQFDEFSMSESRVIIRKGQLLQGVLDKTQYGASTFGLIHCVYELYGGDIATNLLTAFTKLFTFFLQWEGFTLGVKDILVTQEADAKRRKIIKESRETGNAVVASALELDEVPPLDILAQKMEEAYMKDPKFRVVLDRKYKSVLDGYTNEINTTCLQNGLVTKFPENNLQLMVLSGAKGSMVNTMQISCLLGQIELEGKRPPLMISGKSLPSFAAFETSPKSGGFIDGRFMTGIQPQDFFFHCMAGREGLIDTAVKTSRSGYLQRCLIKHLEGLTVNYDLTVRDSDSTVIQYLYGEDGLDILKSKFIFDKYGSRFLAHNAPVVLQKDEIEAIKDSETFSKVKRHAKKIRSWKKKETSDKRHYSAFTHFSAELRHEVEVERPNEINPKTGRRRIDESILTVWKKADQSNKDLYRKLHQRCPYPTASIYSQDRNYGSTSELIEKIINEYRDVNSERQAAFADIMYLKNMRSLVAPGEPVGLLAAQSIGEPSTQMTLNTFHFAGRGEMNVTLGIPRLREILMLASAKIKTPSMDIPILPRKEKTADKLRIKLNRVTLADVLQSVNVKFKLVLKPECYYQYKLRFQFLPREAYKDDFCVKPKNVLKYMSEIFFKILFRTIIKIGKSKKKAIIDFDEIGKQGKSKEDDDDNQKDLDGDDDNADDLLAPSNTNSKRGNTTTVTEDIENANQSSDEEGSGDDDDDATGIKLKSRKEDETEYDDPEDGEAIDVEDDDESGEDEQLGDNADDAESQDEMKESADNALLKNELITDYLYDNDHHLWCELTFKLDLHYKRPDMASIIRGLANKCVIHEVPNIKRAIIYKNDKDEQVLKTDGINIGEICKHNKILDVNRLYCNDIHSIAKTYGIEAATQVIVKEITNVFKVYGITINHRHLSLIADYMTFDGTFQPLSRKGMANSSSPLQQMSFEASMYFLQNAAGSGRTDALNSPSSRLMVGLPVKHGTGSFDLLTSIA